MGEKIHSNPNSTKSENRASKIEFIDEGKMAIREGKELSKEIQTYERGFTKQLERSDGKVPKKEFETWENLLGDQLRIIQDKVNFGNLSLEQEAEARHPMITYRKEEELQKTIEAQAANFYHERFDALQQAIKESDSPTKDEDLAYIKNYYGTVVRHLDFKYMDRDEVADYGYEAYESGRTRAHNNTIKHLNGMNNLARKYHTRPFTVRNFWTSDLRRKEDQTPAVADIMRYDRDIVEEYYAIAFSSEVQKREYQQKRNRRYGFY